MKTILLNILLFVSLCECHVFRCDYAYNEVAQGFFKLHPFPTDWSDARLRCYLEGANLASPTTPGVLKGMRQIIEEKKVYSGVYTGIHATFSKSYFVTVEGVPTSEINLTWANEIPSTKNNKDCAVLVPSNSLYGVDCSATYPFICYKKMKNEKEINNCGTTDDEYNEDTRTGSCYKFHKVARSWPSAYLTCQAEGGHLAIVNGDVEAQVLKNIFNSQLLLKSPLIGAATDSVALLGFRSWDEHGVMYTIHGDLLEKAGYDTFTPGSPSSAEGQQYCGAMAQSGLLEDIACDVRLAFICEKSHESIFCDL